jgi:tetratricopeptide (TPR) repeat protein
MGESIILGNLALYTCRTGDLATARAHGLRALEVARAIDDRIGQGTIFNILGEIELKSGSPDQAVDFFRQALEINTSLGLGAGVAEAKAGLAAAHTAGTGLAAERQAQVRGYMEDVLAYIREKLAASAEAGPLPAMTVLRCLKALQALQDPEAESLFAAVRERLHRQAQRIQDPELRRAFLEQVPAHRELLALSTHSFLAPLND